MSTRDATASTSETTVAEVRRFPTRDTPLAPHDLRSVDQIRPSKAAVSFILVAPPSACSDIVRDPSPTPHLVSPQARTALRRGAALLKYCRNAKPHVSHFQLSVDESRLEWVSKNASVKWVDVDSITDVFAGRATEIFAAHKNLIQQHPPEVCLSVLYMDAKRKSQSLNLVFETAETRDVWRKGLLATKEIQGEIKNEKNDDKTLKVDMRTAMLVNKAMGRFKKSVSVDKKLDTSPIAEPNDLFVWGRVAQIDGGGAFVPHETPTTSGRDEERPSSGNTAKSASRRSTAAVKFEMKQRRTSTVPPVAQEVSEAVKLASLSATPRRVAGTDGIDVSIVAVGASHVAAVVTGRGLYTWGEGKGGRLGHGTHASHTRPTRVGLSGDENVANVDDISSVCCAGSVTFAVSGDGNVRVWGDASGGSSSVFGLWSSGGLSASHNASSIAWRPMVLSSLSHKAITSITAGSLHVAAISEDGALFTWGEGIFGALGHGEFDGEEMNQKSNDHNIGESPRLTSFPTQVTALKNKRVTSVSCGRWHTAAVVDGELYTWGDADGGKLGISDITPQTFWLPTKVNLESQKLERVSCGVWHTLCLAEDGQVYQSGAVGGSDVSVCHKTPTKVMFGAEQSNSNIEQNNRNTSYTAPYMASGDLHAAVFVKNSGIYTWGSGLRGALGHGDTNHCEAPKLVDALVGREVRSLACGPTSTAAVVSPKVVSDLEKASDAKAGSKITKRFDASQRSGLSMAVVSQDGVPNNARPPRASAARAGVSMAVVSEGPGSLRSDGRVFIGPSTHIGGFGGLDGLGEFTTGSRRSSVADLARVSGTSLRRSESSNEGSFRGGSRHGGFDPESPTVGTYRYSSFAFSKARSIGAESGGSVGRARTDDAARAGATERARAEAAMAVAERDVLRMEVASLRTALRLAARDEISTLAITRHSVHTSMTPPLPTRTVATDAAEEADTLAAFALSGDRQTVPATTPRNTSTPTPFSSNTPNTPNANTSGTPAGTPDLVNGSSEPKRHAPSPSPSPSPSQRVVIPDDDTSSLSPSAQEWVEEVEPGVFMTIGVEPGTGHHTLRRVRFSKRVFSDTEATAWWTKNRARVVRTRGLTISK